MVTIGSVSYAEDDNRHYLGIKAAVVSKDGKSQYFCYVIECDNEVSISYFRPFYLSFIKLFKLINALSYILV